jgi:hypothetical protein
MVRDEKKEERRMRTGQQGQNATMRKVTNSELRNAKDVKRR